MIYSRESFTGDPVGVDFGTTFCSFSIILPSTDRLHTGGTWPVAWQPRQLRTFLLDNSNLKSSRLVMWFYYKLPISPSQSRSSQELNVLPFNLSSFGAENNIHRQDTVHDVCPKKSTALRVSIPGKFQFNLHFHLLPSYHP